MAGADPMIGGGALLAGWGAGAGGMIATAAGGVRPAGTGPGLALGQPAATPAGGVLGTGSLAGSGKPTPAAAGRPGGPGQGMAGQAAATSRNGVIGGAGHDDDEDTDERLTWLTEDEMVWQGADDAAPPVLGPDGR